MNITTDDIIQITSCVHMLCQFQILQTLWNMAFAGEARSVCCKYCLGLSHSEQHCELASPQKQATDP